MACGAARGQPAGLPTASPAPTTTKLFLKQMKTKTFAVVMSGLILSFAVLNVEAVQIRGVRSCGVWINDKGTMQEPGHFSWLLGFLSGISIATDNDFLRGTESESISLWVDNYCRANPLDTLSGAGQLLAAELIKKGLRR